MRNSWPFTMIYVTVLLLSTPSKNWKCIFHLELFHVCKIIVTFQLWFHKSSCKFDAHLSLNSLLVLLDQSLSLNTPLYWNFYEFTQIDTNYPVIKTTVYVTVGAGIDKHWYIQKISIKFHFGWLRKTVDSNWCYLSQLLYNLIFERSQFLGAMKVNSN